MASYQGLADQIPFHLELSRVGDGRLDIACINAGWFRGEGFLDGWIELHEVLHAGVTVLRNTPPTMYMNAGQAKAAGCVYPEWAEGRWAVFLRDYWETFIIGPVTGLK